MIDSCCHRIRAAIMHRPEGIRKDLEMLRIVPPQKADIKMVHDMLAEIPGNIADAQASVLPLAQRCRSHGGERLDSRKERIDAAMQFVHDLDAAAISRGAEMFRMKCRAISRIPLRQIAEKPCRGEIVISPRCIVSQISFDMGKRHQSAGLHITHQRIAR